jgi:hypothetical protein
MITVEKMAGHMDGIIAEIPLSLPSPIHELNKHQ